MPICSPFISNNKTLSQTKQKHHRKQKQHVTTNIIPNENNMLQQNIIPNESNMSQQNIMQNKDNMSQ